MTSCLPCRRLLDFVQAFNYSFVGKDHFERCKYQNALFGVNITQEYVQAQQICSVIHRNGIIVVNVQDTDDEHKLTS